MPSRRSLFLHIGSGKTGTSSLQRGLWRSTEQLEAVGVAVPLAGREQHLRQLLSPLGWAPGVAFEGTVDHTALTRLARRLAATPGRALLMSNEELAEAGPEHAAALAEVADHAGLELHVVLTARDWAQQLPSEWQQFLKRRMTTDYPTFLDQVRDGEGPDASRFQRRQDVFDICTRWSSAAPAERVHVVPVPSVREDPGAVFRHFGEIVGYDPAVVRVPYANVNGSFGYAEAEVLRRLNCELGDALPDFVQDYLPAIRRRLVRYALGRGASARIPLPEEHLDWVRARSRLMVDDTVAAGYTFHGDSDVLVPGPGAGAPLPELDEADVAAAAIRTLAAYAVKVHKHQL